MTESYLHLAVSAIQAVLAVWAMSVYLRSRRWSALIVVVVVLGLTYDNAVLGAGRFLGHGAVLEGLSYPRFWLHALTTPLLMLSGLSIAAAAGHVWARSAWVRTIVGALALAMVALGVLNDVIRLELAPATEAGVLSYSNAAGVVPLPAIVTIVVLVAFGVAVWVRPGWPWLAVGAIAMLVSSGLMVSGLIVNVGELALLSSLVATEARAGRWQQGTSGRRSGG